MVLWWKQLTARLKLLAASMDNIRLIWLDLLLTLNPARVDAIRVAQNGMLLVLKRWLQVLVWLLNWTVKILYD